MRFVVAVVSLVSLSLFACGPSRRDRSAHSAQSEEDDDDFISKKKKRKKGGGEEGSGDAGDIVGWKRVVSDEDAKAFVPLFGKAARIHGCKVQENGAAVVADCDGKDIRIVRDGGKILIGCKGWGTLEQCQQLFNEIIESAKKTVPPPSGNQANGNPPASGGAAYAVAPTAPASTQALKPTQTLPVAIGTARDAVRQSFGKPTFTGADFDSFAEQGVSVDYQNGIVVAVTGTYMNNGKFRGQVLGVALAEPYSRCIDEWGTPVSRKPSGYEFDIVTWVYAGYTIEIELWNKDSFQKSFGGDMKQDTVKRIKVRR